MHSKVTFDIPGKPVPWSRARTNGKRRFHTPQVIAAKQAAGTLCKAAMKKAGVSLAPAGVAVSLSILAVYELPQRIPNGDNRRMGSKHIMTPDADNIAKLIKDGLNGIAYKDDCQVFELVVRKVWSDHSRTSVTIEFLKDG